MNLRPYQHDAINSLYWHWKENAKSNVVLQCPTGSGKSVILAELIRDVLRRRKDARILVLSHVREILTQNADHVLKHFPECPLGIYSAGLNSRGMNQVTIAGIASIYKRADEIGFQNLIIIDEAHLCGVDDDTMYRKLIDDLTKINPLLRVVGLSASPWRADCGSIVNGGLFTDLIEVVGIMDLVDSGYLVPLRSKHTELKYDVSGVSIQRGDYVERELDFAVNTPGQNSAVVREIIERGKDRRSWLIFGASKDHADQISVELLRNGIEADAIFGDTEKDHRDWLIERFKAGKMRALCNYSVLTVGFDAPCVDMIAMLRPTRSLTLYIQSAGRGMRIMDGKKDCLYLDFAGVVDYFGPITDPQIPEKRGDGTGDPITKNCPACGEIVGISTRICPVCGEAFPPPEKKKADTLHNDDIMAREVLTGAVVEWEWGVHTKRSNGSEMFRVRYYVQDSYKSIDEYLTVNHEGFPGELARRKFMELASRSGYRPTSEQNPDLRAIASDMQKMPPPREIRYKYDGKYPRIISKVWEEKT